MTQNNLYCDACKAFIASKNHTEADFERFTHCKCLNNTIVTENEKKRIKNGRNTRLW